MQGKNFLLAVLAIVLLVGGYFYYKYRVAPEVDFTNLELTDLEGKPVSLTEVQGHKLFVSFFATWCGPCVYEIPLLENIWTELSGEDFVFVLISDENLPKLKRFAESSGTTIRILHSKQKLKDMGIHSVPTNYLLNAKGKVVMERVNSFEGNATGIANEFRELCR